jgi:hypothetical protein
MEFTEHGWLCFERTKTLKTLRARYSSNYLLASSSHMVIHTRYIIFSGRL